METAIVAAECWFLDVGQGASQVILLPDGGAIVIDCGPCNAAQIPLRVLKRHLQADIEAFIVTHNDADHDGASSRLFTEFASRIKSVVYLHDRPARDILLFSLVKQFRAEGRFRGAEYRLEAGPGLPPIYRDEKRQIVLSVLAPEFRSSLTATCPNAMSGILSLECGSRKIVFAGDASLSEWRALNQVRKQPLDCDVAGVPHHGGSSGDDLWLYSAALQIATAVISVGSSNRFGKNIHPAPEAVSRLVATDAKVMCTQITPHCCDNLEGLRPGVLPPSLYGKATNRSDMSSRERSRNVGCAGTIQVQIGPNTVRIESFQRHQQAIDRLTRAGRLHPLCRTAFNPPPKT